MCVGRDAEAINLLLSRYDDYRHAIELYEEIYRDMLQWEYTRAILCLSRLLITEYYKREKVCEGHRGCPHSAWNYTRVCVC